MSFYGARFRIKDDRDVTAIFSEDDIEYKILREVEYNNIKWPIVITKTKTLIGISVDECVTAETTDNKTITLKHYKMPVEDLFYSIVYSKENPIQHLTNSIEMEFNKNIEMVIKETWLRNATDTMVLL